MHSSHGTACVVKNTFLEFRIVSHATSPGHVHRRSLSFGGAPYDDENAMLLPVVDEEPAAASFRCWASIENHAGVKLVPEAPLPSDFTPRPSGARVRFSGTVFPGSSVTVTTAGPEPSNGVCVSSEADWGEFSCKAGSNVRAFPEFYDVQACVNLRLPGGRQQVVEEPAPEEPPNCADAPITKGANVEQMMEKLHRLLYPVSETVSHEGVVTEPVSEPATDVICSIGHGRYAAESMSNNSFERLCGHMGESSFVEYDRLQEKQGGDLSYANASACLTRPDGLRNVSKHPEEAASSWLQEASRRKSSIARCRGVSRLWCHIYLHMKHASFDLVPMLIGHSGAHTRHIANSTGAKIRIRGQGSGHKEGHLLQEANVPLMLAVTTGHRNHAGFELAVRMSAELLRKVERRFVIHCCWTNTVLSTSVPFTLGECSDGCWEWLQAALETGASTSNSFGVEGRPTAMRQ